MINIRLEKSKGFNYKFYKYVLRVCRCDRSMLCECIDYIKEIQRTIAKQSFVNSTANNVNCFHK